MSDADSDSGETEISYTEMNTTSSTVSSTGKSPAATLQAIYCRDRVTDLLKLSFTFVSVKVCLRSE